jgi:hypothetical protein
VPEELAKYGEYGRMLLRVKPGLTGQWQVNGRSGVGYPERARIDLAYLAQRNLYQDLRAAAADGAGGSSNGVARHNGPHQTMAGDGGVPLCAAHPVPAGAQDAGRRAAALCGG